jgi:hypothetical protein
LVKREFCDTWHLAQALRIGDDKEIQEALTAYAFSEHSRFAVQSELPAQDTLLYGKWEKKNGIHLSNTFFLPYTPTTYGGGSNGYRESYGPYSTKFKTWDGKRGVWVEHTMPAEDADDEELTAFFKRIDMEEDAAAADEAALALLPRGTHSERRIEAQMDIAADASMLYNPEDQDIVYERVYNRLHAMTDAEFLEAETNCGYGVHALEGMVDDAWQWVDDTEYQPFVAEEKV